MSEEDRDLFQRHEVASSAAPTLALISVAAMNLPSEIPLDAEVHHLSPRASDLARRIFSRVFDEYGAQVPALVGWAVRDMWLACWQGAHYIRLLHEPLIGHIEIPAESRRLWEAEGYAGLNGWAPSLFDEVLKLKYASERLTLLASSPFAEVPDTSSLLRAASLYFFHRADQAAAEENFKLAFDWLHEAYDSVSLEHGNWSWEGGVEDGKQSSTDTALEAARSALAKNAAKARHAENRALKQQVFEWCDGNMANTPSMDAAASLVAGVIVPVAWRTVREWMTDWRKLRSAGTA